MFVRCLRSDCCGRHYEYACNASSRTPVKSKYEQISDRCSGVLKDEILLFFFVFGEVV